MQKENNEALVDLIYQSVLEPIVFPTIMERLSNRSGVDNDVVKLPPSKSISPIDVTHVHEPSLLENHVLDELLPHLKRVLSISKKFVDLEQHDESNNQLIESLPLSIFLVDNQAKLIRKNQAASALCLKRSVVELKSNHLAFTDQAINQLFLSSIDEISVPRAKPNRSTQFKIPYDNTQLVVTLLNQPRNQIDDEKWANTYVIISEPQTLSKASLDEFKQEYRLSNKELDLTYDLINGKKPVDIAEERHISIHTVRTHLKNVLQKTNTQSQSSLIALTLVSSFKNMPLSTNKESTDSFLQYITLNDERMLSYGEYGNPKGEPIFFCHGICTCSLDHPDEAYLIKHNIRLIVPNRPGYSDSDPNPGHTLEDVAHDYAELAKQLGIATYSVMAVDLSSAFALSIAKHYPANVDKVILLDGASPYDLPSTLPKRSIFYHLVPKLAKASPNFIRYLTYLAFRNFKDNEEKAINNFFALLERENQEVLSTREIQKRFINIVKEAIIQGSSAIAHNQLLVLGKWNIRLEEIHAPVFLCVGNTTEQSNFHAVQLERYLSNTTRVDFYNSCWAKMLYQEFDQVYSRLRAAMKVNKVENQTNS